MYDIHYFGMQKLDKKLFVIFSKLDKFLELKPSLKNIHVTLEDYNYMLKHVPPKVIDIFYKGHKLIPNV